METGLVYLVVVKKNETISERDEKMWLTVYILMQKQTILCFVNVFESLFQKVVDIHRFLLR